MLLEKRRSSPFYIKRHTGMYDGWAQEDLGLARWLLKTTRYQAFLVSPASDLIGELRHIGVCRNGISPSRLLTGYSFQQYIIPARPAQVWVNAFELCIRYKRGAHIITRKYSLFTRRIVPYKNFSVDSKEARNEITGPSHQPSA